ncbi:hypothetical protein G6O69_05140 [Pseudenhygromyxa sp. WMMC2535]|nr:hypothetical protein [Pseudenhygromyxa sp. WMMC2535]
MKRTLPAFALASAGLLGAGCADDATPSGSDEADTGDSESESDSGEESESGSGTMETETDTETETETETAATEINVSGEVTDFFTMAGIPGANVSVLDMPGFETVSDEEGEYAIPGMPPNTEVFFLIDGNEDTYWGGIRPATIPEADVDDLQLGQVSNELIDTQLSLLQQQDENVTADETKGVAIVRLRQPTATGAVVTFEPALPDGSYYGVDADNKPVLNGDTIDSSLLPFWVAFNLEPADAGTYSVSVEHPERECTVLHPSFPTLPRYVTLIEIDCPPAP